MIYQREFQNDSVKHLDFACGTGRILELFRKFVETSTGVDVSKSMLGVARSRLQDVELLEADLTEEDVFSNRKFDLITAFRFFPMAEPALREQAMNALAVRLEEGGRLVFNNHKQSGSLTQRVANMIGKGDLVTMSHEEVVALASGAGLSIDYSMPIGILPLSEHWTWLPMTPIRAIEGFLARRPSLVGYSSNRIYVCKKSG